MFRTTTLLATLALAGVAPTVHAAPAAPAAGQQDIVDTAVAAGSFDTLATALKAAHLVDALKGEGPFTVFAPTDEAFAKLPEKTLESLLRPENRDQLTSILTYHVVPGRVPASQVVRLAAAPTLNGQRASVSTENGVMIDGANVVTTDIECTNGIIHVIDSVILPSSDTVVDIAVGNDDFSTLVAAVKAAGLVETLSGDGPFTVFAPKNDAFAQIPEAVLGELLKKENRATLTKILTYHVVPGRVYGDQAIKAGSAATVEGRDVDFRIRNGMLMVNGASVVANDIDASNGVVHVIDTVLLPPGLELPQPSGRLVIGIYDEAPSAALASQLGLDPHASMVITRIVEGSMAETCGLQRYDVITSIDGRPASDDALTEAKKRAGYGGEIALTILRGGHEQQVTCKVGLETS